MSEHMSTMKCGSNNERFYDEGVSTVTSEEQVIW